MKAARFPLFLLTITVARALPAQHTHGHDADSARMVGAADAAMSGAMSGNEMKHLSLSPVRPATRDDSARAMAVVRALRTALAKYADTVSAVADGYRMFAPQIRNQRVYHFTSYRHAFMEGFRFDPAKPTSLLYEKDTAGRFRLVGAMYTAPKRARLATLDERVPLSIARWHRHVKWCVPKRGEADRWYETKDGAPVFGPRSPIETKAACDAAGGRFFENPLGWMLHVNAFTGDELGAIFAHDH